MVLHLTFDALRKVNTKRCESSQGFNHRIEDWTPNDWMVATTGELGEAANILKKLKRVEDDLPGNTVEETYEVLEQRLADELADTVIYLDLLAARCNINLGEAIISKFNRTSNKINSPHVL